MVTHLSLDTRPAFAKRRALGLTCRRAAAQSATPVLKSRSRNENRFRLPQSARAVRSVAAIPFRPGVLRRRVRRFGGGRRGRHSLEAVAGLRCKSWVVQADAEDQARRFRTSPRVRESASTSERILGGVLASHGCEEEVSVLTTRAQLIKRADEIRSRNRGSVQLSPARGVTASSLLPSVS